MTGELIDLKRRFRPATEDGDRSFHGPFGSDKLSSTWSDLLAKRRVVVLGEAGSGKSTEFERQQAAVPSEGKFSFLVTVRDVADAGVEGAMPPAMRRAFGEWSASPEAECWLFVDSIDEAINVAWRPRIMQLKRSAGNPRYPDRGRRRRRR